MYNEKHQIAGSVPNYYLFFSGKHKILNYFGDKLKPPTP
jgi:hypothetical protein